MTAELKTRPTGAAVEAFLDGAPRSDDARRIAAIMAEVSGEPATMWGPGIVGYGSYHYRYDSGHEGDMCRIGFSPRKAALTLYIDAGEPARADVLARLGKHTTGKSCLYIKKLADVDEGVLRELIADAWEDMRARYPA
jgi:hypothetical protein